MIGDILQPTHLLFVLVVALLVLGPKRLPEVGRSLGRGLRDFRSALSGDESHNESITPPGEEATPAADPARQAASPVGEVVEDAEPVNGETVGQAPPPVTSKPTS